MKLNFDQVGSGESLIILHGLFGSANNFRSLAKKYGEHYAVYCLDLRNHGLSPHDDDVSFDAMAADIIEFMDSQSIENTILMGHSLGGKVAMHLALNYPHRVSKLIAGDIAPVEYPHHHDGIFEGLNEVTRRNPASRKQAGVILEDYVEMPEVRLFLLTNLSRTEDGTLAWRLNVSGLEHGYADLAAKPYGPPYSGPSLFIRGSLSDYVKQEHFSAIYELFPAAEITTLAGTGHWLHAEKPKEYIEITLEFLDKE